MIVQISCLGIQWNTKNEKEWIVFNIKRNTLLAERDGENITIYGNDSLLKTVPKNKTLKSYQIGNLSRIRTKKKLQNLFYFNGNKILIIDSFAVFPKNMKPDILILTQSPKINVERLLQTIRPKIIIADASNYKTIQKQWKATCLKQKIPFHATSEKGYYKLNH
jgi:competence protein ComEC